MHDMLQEIVSHKRAEVQESKSRRPLEELKRQAQDTALPRDFFGAVVCDPEPSDFRIIAEVKRKSPSAGQIRADFDPVDIAKRYHHAGAAAISCLTDEHFFGGELGYIDRIRQAVPLPVIRKDFIIDAYQIWESRAAGADAILLIAEILTEGQIIDYQILATELGLTSLLEVHDVENLYMAMNHIGFPNAKFSLLGINNRDLDTMSVDLGHTLRMVDLVEDRRIVVSESGIQTGSDLARLRAHGINIALVGEHLMKQPDPGAGLRQLLEEFVASESEDENPGGDDVS